jgi:protocatechuate 3,4-dioxygenase beta subunit
VRGVNPDGGLFSIRDALTRAFALLACLFFVIGLTDTPRALLDVMPAPALPKAALVRDAALLVRVFDRHGAPLASARLNAFWERDGIEHFVRAAETDTAGSAELAELPRGVTWLLAEAPGHARASVRRELGAGTNRVDLKLQPEATTLVRVTDERGAPIAGATVLVSASDPLPYGALTEASGRALVKRLPPAPWTVKASAAGYESSERTNVSGEVTLALRRLATLRVRVEFADKRPAAGASVAIAGSTLWPARRTPADATGLAHISGLLEGAYDLEATLDGFVSQPHVGFELARGADADVTLVLEAGRFIHVVVSDGSADDAVSVPDADVVLTAGGVGSFPRLGRTGHDGKLTLGPIPHAPATLAARADGFVSSQLVAVPDEIGPEPVRIALIRGATLMGEVVDGRGFPVEGASIEVVGTDAFGLPVAETPFLAAFRNTHFDWAFSGPATLIPAGELGVMPGPVPPIPAAGVRIEAGTDLWSLADVPPPLIEAWVTRSDGRFTARPVTPGRVRAVARHPDYVEGASELVTLGPGGEARVKIVMLGGGSLAGRVLDDRSMPVEGAEVEVASTNTSLVRTALTASDGSFEFSGIPSRVVISVRRNETETRVALRKSAEIVEGKRTELDLVLPPLRDPVQIVVTGESDAPIELAEVTVLSLDPDVPLRETSFTDSEGATELMDGTGLPLRVVVEAPGFPRKAVVVDHAANTLRVTLSAGIIVEGTVTAVRGRSFVEGAFVTLLSEGSRRTTLTDAEGHYRIHDIAPGRAHLSVTHPDYARVDLDVVIEATGRADRAFELGAVDMSEPGGIEGEVVDEQGEPVSGARVSLGVAPAYLPAGALPPGVAQTDGNGRFVLEGVAEGVHVLDALSSVAGRGQARGVEVRTGRVTDGVRITLGPTGGDDLVEGGNIALTLGERGTGTELEIVIVAVAPSGEAERAGVTAGDVIAGIDGTRPTSLSDARRRLSGRPGTDVVVELLRANDRIVLRIAREAVRQ